MTAVIDNPIPNSPFGEPGRHWLLDDRGIPTGAIEPGRRRSEYIVPVPPPRHITQGVLLFVPTGRTTPDAPSTRSWHSLLFPPEPRLGAVQARAAACPRFVRKPVPTGQLEPRR